MKEEAMELLSAYGQKRLAASYRMTRWVYVWVGVVVLGDYELMMLL